MVKHIRPAGPPVVTEQWPKLQEDVEVELTSEDPESPIERALLGEGRGGWRAGGPGPQTITLTWPTPIAIRGIRFVFKEHSQARTQESVVRASTGDGQREIVRQHKYSHSCLNSRSVPANALSRPIAGVDSGRPSPD